MGARHELLAHIRGRGDTELDVGFVGLDGVRDHNVGEPAIEVLSVGDYAPGG